MKKWFVLLMVVIALYSCQKDKVKGGVYNPDFATELKSSPEQVNINENHLVLSTELWRDFMPIAEEEGSKMMCLNWLEDSNNLPLVSSLTLKKQYVINGDEVWGASYEDIHYKNDFTLEGRVGDGPKWGPDIAVDVVCEFENNGTTYRIIAKSQMIGATY